MDEDSSQSVPATMRALVCEDVGQPLTVEIVPVPEAVPGSVLVKVLFTLADANLPRCRYWIGYY